MSSIFTKLCGLLLSDKMSSLIIPMLILFNCTINSNIVKAQFEILTPPAICQIIEDIDIDKAGNILFATDDGILIFDTKQKWTHFNKQNGLNNSHIKSIKHNGNNFVFSEINKRIGSSNYLTVSDSIFNPSFNYNYISVISVDTNGNTLLGTDNGIVFLQKSNGIVNKLNLGTTLGTVNHIVYVTNPPLNNTNFYGITSSDKAVLFDVSSNQTYLVVNTSTTPLPSNNIISSTYANNFAYDGTDKGIFKVDFNNFPNFAVEILNKSNTPIPNDTINAIAVSGTSIFVGTPQGLACKINNKWKTYNTLNSNLPSNDIGELALNATDLWIGTKQGQICKINTNQITDSKNELGHLTNNITVNLTADHSNIIIKSYNIINGKLFLYDVNGRLLSKTILNDSAQSIPVNNYPTGVYFYQISNNTGDNLKTGKVIL
ncbi:MAG TPA: T9SS type A sorting domain-containing protein [Saprospiraceae bacterium]|nr:T9SS type A sorting domain-containing protein [Saprospiraceae bacterium]